MLGHLLYCRKNPNTAVVHVSSVHACFRLFLFGYDTAARLMGVSLQSGDWVRSNP